jgi:phosphonopyruvate decarboxylase
MMNPQDFTKLLEESGFNFFTGVPDSTMKEWIADISVKENHVAAVNECEAVAIAAGYYLASKNPACVYMQNAGLGKTVNPLTSLCDKEVYGIPALLIVGWRGEPGVHDEPQHKKMGKITTALLDVLGVPWKVLPGNMDGARGALADAKKYMETESAPYALIVKPGIFEKTEIKKSGAAGAEMLREEAVGIIAGFLPADAVIVSTTGKTSRELFEYREKNGGGHEKDFLTVGSMGCASSIAFGISRAEKKRKVAILDGDGAVLMQMGTFATIGHYAPENILHIVFDNGSYESTGGQATVSASVDFIRLASSCGYKKIYPADNPADLRKSMAESLETSGPVLLVVKVKTGSRENLGRPTASPQENKTAFMRNL